MIDNAIFRKIGLNEKESLLYLTVLQNSGIGAKKIEMLTGIGRTHIYDIAQKLSEKGFLSQLDQNKKRVFSATSPKEILDRQKKDLSDFENTLEELESLQNNNAEKPKIIYYSGKNELDVLHSNFISNKISKEALAFSDESFYLKNAGALQEKEISKRMKQGVHFRAIAGMSQAVLDSKKKDLTENRETRILPSDIFNPKAQLGVHGNKTIVVNYEKNYAFTVEDEDLATTIKQIFELTWKSGRIIE